MSSEHVKKELQNITENNSYPYPLNMAMAASWLLINLKGSNIRILKTGEKSSLCDYFVLATAQNPMQAETMAEWISVELKAKGVNIRSREGNRLSDWLLLDMGDVIVHVFLEESRSIYALDELWADSPAIAIPESFYFDSHIIEQGQSTVFESQENYF